MRNSFAKFLTPAHSRRFMYMFPAITGTVQLGITSAVFINILTIKIGKPRFDFPGWNKCSDLIIACTGIDTSLATFPVKLLDSAMSTPTVAVNHHGEI